MVVVTGIAFAKSPSNPPMKSPARFLFVLPLLLSAVASVGCSATMDSYPDPMPTTDRAVVAESAPREMVGSWQSESGQGNSSTWTFEADGKALHTLVIVSGPAACRKTSTTLYEGSVTSSDRTLTFTATEATIADVDCNGADKTAGIGYSETLTYELSSPTELVLREVSKCPQTDQASKDTFCKSTFAKQS